MIKNYLSVFAGTVSKRQVILTSHRFSLSTFGLFLTFNFALLTIQCGLDVEDPTPPPAPVWVQKSLPEEWPERGIDAHESGGIYLEWETGLSEDIAAYYIYRANYYSLKDSLGDYVPVVRLNNAELSVSDYVDETVAINVPYYYKLKAEDRAGNKSNSSDSALYSVQTKINIYTMTPNGQTDDLASDRILTWNNDYFNEVEDYCLTILTQQNELVIRTVFQPTTYLSNEEHWAIPDSILLQSGNFYKWRIDTGARYQEELETAGSESQWATFFVHE